MRCLGRAMQASLEVCPWQQITCMDFAKLKHISDGGHSTHEHVVCWSIAKEYPRLTSQLIRNTFAAPKLLHYDECFEVLNKNSIPDGEFITSVISFFVGGAHNIAEELEVMLKKLAQEAWIPTVLSKLVVIDEKTKWNKFNPNQFSDLIANFAALGQAGSFELIKVHDYHPNKIHNNLPEAIKNKKDVNIDDEVVSKKIDEMVAEESPTFK
jgi:hypothetical protein